MMKKKRTFIKHKCKIGLKNNNKKCQKILKRRRRKRKNQH